MVKSFQTLCDIFLKGPLTTDHLWTKMPMNMILLMCNCCAISKNKMVPSALCRKNPGLPCGGTTYQTIIYVHYLTIHAIVYHWFTQNCKWCIPMYLRANLCAHIKVTKIWLTTWFLLSQSRVHGRLVTPHALGQRSPKSTKNGILTQM